MARSSAAGGARALRLLIALLGLLAVAALAPQLASAVAASGTISGTVTNAAHQGIAGTAVQVTDLSTGSDYVTSTASDGTYAVSGLPSGSYQVLFLPPYGQDYLYQYYPGKSNSAAAQAVTVTAGQTTSNIDASLATGATISGKVTDAAGGAPLSGVLVYVRDYSGGYPTYVSPTSATTDGNGMWSITGLPTGLYQVQFYPTSNDYASQQYKDVMGQDSPTPVTLTAGSTTPNIDAALTRAGQISGTVTDGTSNLPAKDVTVLAFDRGGNEWSNATTDASGHYTLKGLTPSADYRVEFYPAQTSALGAQFYPSGVSLQAATPVRVALGQTTANIDETLGQGGSISGAVTDAATGYPLGGVSIVLTDDAGHQVYSGLSPITQPDGTYVINHLAPGSYKVQFSSVGALAFQYYNDANTLSSATSVTVSAGQTATNISGALAQGGSLAGVITDASTGQGIAYAYLEVLDTRGNLVTYGSAEPNGHYQIHGIAPGSYYLQVAAYNNGLNQVQYYGGSRTLAGAKLVTIAPGATTSGIDIAVAPDSPASPSVSVQSTGTPATTSQTPVAVVTQVIPGPPTLSGGSVSGLGRGKPVVKFRLRSGSNGARRLRSFKVKLPAGLSFVGAQLRKGVKVTGGGKVTERLIAGQLVVTLGSPASAVTVSISSPALNVTRTLAAHSLRVLVTVTPVNAAGHLLSFTVKNPS